MEQIWIYYSCASKGCNINRINSKRVPYLSNIIYSTYINNYTVFWYANKIMKMSTYAGLMNIFVLRCVKGLKCKTYVSR